MAPFFPKQKKCYACFKNDNPCEHVEDIIPSQLSIDRIEEMRKAFRENAERIRSLRAASLTNQSPAVPLAEKVEPKCEEEETPKEEQKGVKTCKIEEDPSMDLSLRLSPPHEVKPKGKSLKRSPISSPISSSISMDLNSNGSNENSEVPSLVLMGCTRCYLYMMVPENDAKCMKCKNTNLLDEFRGNAIKKMKKE